MNHSTDASVDAAAKGNYILLAFQRLATQTDILVPGTESSSMDNIDMDPTMGGQVKEGPRATCCAERG